MNQTRSPPSLDAAVATVLALLAANQASAALPLAEQLCAASPQHPLHWQVLARVRAAMANLTAADQAYARAHELAHGEQQAVIAQEYAGWLLARQEPARACSLLATSPQHSADSRLLLARAAIATGQHALAVMQLALLHAQAAPPPAVLAALIGLYQQHQLLGMAETYLQQWLNDAARPACAWLGLARLQRDRGATAKALSTVQQAVTRWPQDPALADMRSGLLLDHGQPTQALASARAVGTHHPQYLPGLQTLANLLWEHGAVLGCPEHPASPLQQALQQSPGHKGLRIELVGFLLNMGEHEQALSVLQPLLKDRSDALAQWYLGNVLASGGQLAQADGAYQRAERGFARHPALLNARTRLALRRQQVDHAEQLARRCLAIAAHNQEAWSLLSLAWRLRGDARYHWLCDYTRLVAHLPLDGLADGIATDQLLADLRMHLGALHHGSGQPLVQSVRHGSQTSGRLFGRDVAVLQATEMALRHTVQGWLRQLPDDRQHPFLSRRRQGLNFVGSWSVAMGVGGHHTNHIHSQGWLSSALHVSVADAGDGNDNSAGCLQLGQPLQSLGLDLAAERLIVPQPGWLALFPSYFWHGTLPVRSAGQRLSIAFDAQPAD